MKYKYLIFNSYDGVHQGTNSDSVANDHAASDDYVVTDLTTMETIYAGERYSVAEIKEDAEA